MQTKEMITSVKPVNVHDCYHAHVYFDSTSTVTAKNLCNDIIRLFDLAVGRFHQKLVGPHPLWSCQIVFYSDDFDDFVSWLDVHRQGLTIFVHGVTGDDLRDHTEFAYWLGNSVELNLSVFQ